MREKYGLRYIIHHKTQTVSIGLNTIVTFDDIDTIHSNIHDLTRPASPGVGREVEIAKIMHEIIHCAQHFDQNQLDEISNALHKHLACGKEE